MSTFVLNAAQVLNASQWGLSHRCPSCNGPEPGYWRNQHEQEGHTPDCRLHKALTAPATAGQADEVAELRAERDRYKAKLAYLLDHSTYSNSYGVPGSDFSCCFFCDAGGAPGVPFEHQDTCPVFRCEPVINEWFDEMSANTEAMEAAEARATTAEAALAASQAMLREVLDWINGLPVPTSGATSQGMRVYDLLHGRPFRCSAQPGRAALQADGGREQLDTAGDETGGES